MGNAILSFSFARVTEVRHINSCITKGRGEGVGGVRRKKSSRSTDLAESRKLRPLPVKSNHNRNAFQ